MILKLLEIAKLFFWLGLSAFGGPVAHIGLMERDVVAKCQWMTRDAFMDLVGVTALIPGPNSTEMAMHCGFVRAGYLGLVVAGVSFILPAFALTLGLAVLYQASGHLPVVAPFLVGVKPAMIAVMGLAIWKLGAKTCGSWLTGGLALIGVSLVVMGLSEIVTILVVGVLGAVWAWMMANRSRLMSVSAIFFECLKIGSILYGSGYVLIAYVEASFVDKLGWLSTAHLLDAIAIGQLTPGPVLTTATVIGYMMAGTSGAVWATVGIFLPSFFFVMGLHHVLRFLKKSIVMRGFLDGVNAGAVALMGVVTVKMGLTVLVGWQAVTIGLLAAGVLWRFPKVSGVVVVGGSSGLGWVLSLFF